MITPNHHHFATLFMKEPFVRLMTVALVTPGVINFRCDHFTGASVSEVRLKGRQPSVTALRTSVALPSESSISPSFAFWNLP